MKQVSIDRLNTVRGVFDTFKKVGAVKPSHSEMMEMASVYKEEFNREVNMYCSACVIEMITTLHNSLVRAEKIAPVEVKEKVKPKAKRK
jgi:hypothetical protein